jgi:hypothetical protein
LTVAGGRRSILRPAAGPLSIGGLTGIRSAVYLVFAAVGHLPKLTAGFFDRWICYWLTEKV